MIKEIAEENSSEMCNITDTRDTALKHSYKVLTFTEQTQKIIKNISDIRKCFKGKKKNTIEWLGDRMATLDWVVREEFSKETNALSPEWKEGISHEKKPSRYRDYLVQKPSGS